MKPQTPQATLPKSRLLRGFFIVLSMLLAGHMCYQNKEPPAELPDPSEIVCEELPHPMKSAGYEADYHCYPKT